MKILKNTAIILAITVSGLNLTAQGLFVSASAGYSFSANKEYGYIYNQNNSSHLDWTTGDRTRKDVSEQVALSFGKGFSFGGSVGYMFTKNVGFDLGVSYLYGNKNTGTQNSIQTETDFNGNNRKRETNSDLSYSSKMFRVLPSFLITTDFGKFNPYAKLGVLFGFGSVNVIYDYSFYNSQSNPTTGTEYKESTYNGDYSFGLNASAGVGYSLSEKLTLFAEFNYMASSYSPSKSTITKYEVNGKDVLPQLSVSNVETDFVTDITRTDVQDIDQPTKRLKMTLPFGSWGFLFGIKYSFKNNSDD